MVIVSCLLIAVGFFGYLKYGDAVAGSITLNLPVDELWVFVMFALKLSLNYFYFLQVSSVSKSDDVTINLLHLCSAVLRTDFSPGSNVTKKV